MSDRVLRGKTTVRHFTRAKITNIPAPVRRNGRTCAAVPRQRNKTINDIICYCSGKSRDPRKNRGRHGKPVGAVPKKKPCKVSGGSAHRPARSIEFLFYRFFMVAAAMIVYSAIACNLFNARGCALCLYFCHQSGIRYALLISDTLSAARVQRGRLAAGRSVRLRYKQCSSYRQPAHFAHPPGCGGA